MTQSDHIRVAPRSYATEQTYVYAFVCEDSFKIGHSGDPLRRLKDLHPRYYEHFDLSESRVVAFPSRQHARAYEKQIQRLLRHFRVILPYEIHPGGKTEWFSRIVLPLLNDLLPDSVPLSPMVVEQLIERIEHNAYIITDCAHEILTRERIRGYHCGTKLETDIINLIDEYNHFNIDLSNVVSKSVLTWCFNQKVSNAMWRAISIDGKLQAEVSYVVYKQLQLHTRYVESEPWVPSANSRKRRAKPRQRTESQPQAAVEKVEEVLDGIQDTSQELREAEGASETSKEDALKSNTQGLLSSTSVRVTGTIRAMANYLMAKVRQARAASRANADAQAEAYIKAIFPDY